MNGAMIKRCKATVAVAMLLMVGLLPCANAYAIGSGAANTGAEASRTPEEKIFTPTVDKLVGEVSDSGAISWQKTADAQANVWVPYKITGTLPQKYDEFNTYHYAFVDQLDPVLEADTSTVDVKLLSGDGTMVSNLTQGFTVTYKNNVLTVSASDLKKIAPQAKAGCKVQVTYKARLVPSQAKPGTADPADNYVYLEFSKDPKTDELGRTPESRARLLTWELDVNKVAAGNTSRHLAGAHFTLKHANGAYVGAQGEPVDKPYEFVTEKNGVAAIPCIDAGTYELTETAAPKGYAKLTAPITITITSQLDQDSVRLGAASDASAATVSAVDTGSGVVRVDVSNGTWSLLPQTGDLSRLAVAGGIAVLGTAIVVLASRRKGEEN